MKREIMKRTVVLFGALAFLIGATVHSAEEHEKGGGESRGGGATAPMRASRPAPVRQPMVIHMNRASNPRPAQQPSYGHIQWSRTTRTHQKSAVSAQRVQATRQLTTARVAGVRSANVVHHHAYQQGYVRQKLAKIGVKSEPSHITDRSEMVSTDRAHSMISYPQTGPKGAAIQGKLVGARQFNNAGVRAQMSLVNRPAFSEQIGRYNASENQRGQTYWHNGNGFNYAHYIDNSGYHWYGFYSGSQYFWTRNYAGRWWWYDSGYNRWCFYNDNYWWWQDPYHVGDLYAYDNADYIPANSADDQIVVSGDEQANEAVYNSPDGSRRVKLVQSDGDAFLYDTAAIPTFDPIYLASGVQSVQYSDVNNGRPLEIILKLNDGSYDMFAADGQPYSSEYSQSN
jgi:hypothetical protein